MWENLGGSPVSNIANSKILWNRIRCACADWDVVKARITTTAINMFSCDQEVMFKTYITYEQRPNSQSQILAIYSVNTWKTYQLKDILLAWEDATLLVTCKWWGRRPFHHQVYGFQHIKHSVHRLVLQGVHSLAAVHLKKYSVPLLV